MLNVARIIITTTSRITVRASVILFMFLKWRAIGTDAMNISDPNDSQSLLHATLSFRSTPVTLSSKGHMPRESPTQPGAAIVRAFLWNHQIGMF